MKPGDKRLMGMDVQAVSALVDTQFPDLAPSRIVPLGEGCDSVAFDVNATWVFRFPKNSDVARQLELEWRMLPLLAPRLPVPIPAFCYHGHPTGTYPHTFVGYAKLPGDPAIGLPSGAMSLAAVGGMLGSFLSALHSFPLAAAERVGVPREPLEDVLNEVKDDALADLPRVREVAPGAPIAEWRRGLSAGVDVPATAREVLLHNDFAAEHVLIDPAEGKITGVIDWSDMTIGDPVVDFAGLFHWGGEALADSVLASYSGSLDDSRLRCARYLGACRGAMDVAFGLDQNRPEYVRSGLRALQLCAGVRA